MDSRGTSRLSGNGTSNHPPWCVRLGLGEWVVDPGGGWRRSRLELERVTDLTTNRDSVVKPGFIGADVVLPPMRTVGNRAEQNVAPDGAGRGGLSKFKVAKARPAGELWR